MPESKVVREFSYLVDRRQSFPSDTDATSERIRESLALWAANNTPLQSIIERSDLLKETQPLAETVAELCKYGIEALDYLESHQKPPRAWREKTATLLERAEKPHAEIYIAILPQLKNWLRAAGMP